MRGVRDLTPTPRTGPSTPDDGSDAWLVARYPDPSPADTRERPWVRANMVSSLDGAVEVDGVSDGLASTGDRRVFGLLRRRADVILVGAGTARAEDYRGARRGRSDRSGGDGPPPVAVVTGSADLDPGARLFTDTRTAPIVITTAGASPDRRSALTRAGADVAVLADLRPETLLAELGRRGLRRVLCEGGPTLLGALVAADVLDELCLTLSPLLAAGRAGRTAVSDPGPPRAMDLVGALEEKGSLLLRYTRRSDRSGVEPPNG
ncbi:riboflavin-specific deaminase-like protein [Pseudonocardia sediminis]|uniref:Riboflavin-specific deaminase-like protein n=1 Tax=Pseudonocardia sediminis TaxID=1397368 RepID=A0A4Q7UYI7_PSEST|nr:riboflavin-specific deaminase-like protein [Pseudonocardia sediminis]